MAPLFFKILGVEFLVTFFPRKFKPVFLEIGEILTSEFFLRDKRFTPLLWGKIKMGGRSISFGARGDESRRMRQFWCIRRALSRLLRKSVSFDPIVLCGQSAGRRALPPCQIWLGAVEPLSRYGGLN